MPEKTWSHAPRTIGYHWVANQGSDTKLVNVIEVSETEVIFQVFGESKIGRIDLIDSDLLWQRCHKPVTPSRIDRRLAALRY